jgi:hypothetical protein
MLYKKKGAVLSRSYNFMFGALVLNLIAPFKSFYSSGGIDNLLFTGKEGMAFAAKLHP